MPIVYVPRPDIINFNERDRPVPVNVKDVLSVIHEPRGSTKLARQVAQYNLHQHIISQLKDELVAPSRVKEFIYDVKRSYERAQIRPGTPYGHGISEAYSATTMQATLNTFHRAGSAQSTGFDEIRGILYLSPIRKNEEVYAHFVERLSPDEIYEIRKDLVEIRASSLVTKFLIEPYDKLTVNQWWYQPQLKANSITPTIENEEGYTETVVVLRLLLDVTKMLEFGITMAHLANSIIAAEDIPNCAISEPVNVNVIFSPMKDGIMDIIFNHKQAKNFAESSLIDVDNAYRIFYNRCFLPHLNNILVSGVEGIERMVVSSNEVVSLVKSEEKVGDDLYLLHKNMMNVNFSGVKDSELFDLLEAVGCEVIKNKRYAYRVRAPSSPLKLIKNSTDDEVKRLKTHYYATISSNRLRYLILQPFIDRDHTYSNNFFVMASVFGLEVARLYHEYNSYQIMSGTGESTNSRYINAFSTVSSSRGMMSGITFAGVAKNAGGFLSIATIEQSGNVFAQQALFNKNGESLKSVSSAISVGTKPFIGTGAYPEEFMARRVMPRLEVKPILNIENEKFIGVNGINVTVDNAAKDSDVAPVELAVEDIKSINQYVGGRTKLAKPPKSITTSVNTIDDVGPVVPTVDESLKIVPSIVTDRIIKELVPPSPYEGEPPEVLEVSGSEIGIMEIPEMPAIQFVANKVILPTIQLYSKN